MKTPKGYGDWGKPARTPQAGPNVIAEDIKEWEELTRLAAGRAAEHDWSKTEFARQAGEASASFSEWYNGRYTGKLATISTRIRGFLEGGSPAGGEQAPARKNGASGYQPWLAPRGKPALDDGELKRWKRLTAACREAAERYQFTKAEVSRRSQVPGGTFSQWYDGTYAGTVKNVSDKVEIWLKSVAEHAAAAARVPEAPGFVATRTARELTDTLLYAQLMAEMVVITLGAGMGKSMTAGHYRDSHPHVHLVTMRPSTARPYTMMRELAQALEVGERNPARLDGAIGEQLKRNGRHTLLIVDEAQNLTDEAVNQLRHFLDVYGVGIALMGNEELYGRFGNQKAVPGYAQIHRRVGKRVRRLFPLKDDIEALIDAWGVKDKDMRALLYAIGKKPGALGQITKTMQLAGMYAAGEGRDVSADDIKQAWEDRAGEELG